MSDRREFTIPSISGAVGTFVIIGAFVLGIAGLGERLDSPCATSRCHLLDGAIGSHQGGFFYLYLFNIIASVFFCVLVMELYNIAPKTFTQS